MNKKLSLLLSLVLGVVFLSACGAQNESQDTTETIDSAAETTESSNAETLKIGAIPDFDQAQMEEAFNDFSNYLSEETGLEVEFVPTVDYASLVTAFSRGDVHLAWFGGLTHVQAVNQVPEAEAFAQRPSDAEFQTVFIQQAGLGLNELPELAGHSFTFGSESSTSGHLMPRYFMTEAGLTVNEDLDGEPNYSGSHDKTYTLVESGAYETGAVNMQYWDKAVEEGTVDTSKVEEFYRTPTYYDYNWTMNANLDEEFGEGTTDQIKEVILNMGPEDSTLMDLLSTESFIPTENGNYTVIADVARELGMVE